MTVEANAAVLAAGVPDDVLVLKARVAELERENAQARADAASAREDYFKWIEKRGRAFTLAEEIVIALGLQQTPADEVMTAALARIRELNEIATRAGAEACRVHGEFPADDGAMKPDYWIIEGTDGEYASALADLADMFDDDDVIEVNPVWLGRQVFVVAEVRDVDGEVVIKRFHTDEEAHAYIAQRDAAAPTEGTAAESEVA